MEKNIGMQLLAHIAVWSFFILCEFKRGVHTHPFFYADIMKEVV